MAGWLMAGVLVSAKSSFARCWSSFWFPQERAEAPIPTRLLIFRAHVRSSAKGKMERPSKGCLHMGHFWWLALAPARTHAFRQL